MYPSSEVLSGRPRLVPHPLRCVGLLAVLFTSACNSAVARDSELVVEVTPAVLTLARGETRPIVVRVLYAAGRASDVTRPFWSTEHVAIATVSQQGIVTGLTPGSTRVSVNVRGHSAVVSVAVTESPLVLLRLTPAAALMPVGAATAFLAEAYLSDGRVATGKAFSWSSSHPAVASVSGEGVVTGLSTGNTTISASVSGVSGSALLTVQPAPVASVTVTPVTGELVQGGFRQLAAVLLDAAGMPLVGYPIMWSSSAPVVAAVSSTGMVAALGVGVATITATSEGKAASATITVVRVPVSRVTTVPAVVTMAIGTSAIISAEVQDSAGGLLLGREVAWAIDAPGTATVSADGIVTAVAEGTATVTATVEGRRAVTTVHVARVAVAKLTVTPATLALHVADTFQLTAIPRDADGVRLVNRGVTWIAGGPSVATVDQQGLVTAIAPGSALLVATSEGQQATVVVNVVARAVAAVRIAPATTTLMAGQSVQLTAASQDDRGNPLTGKVVRWGSSAPNVASVTASGLVTGVGAGAAQITGTVDSVSGVSVISVVAIPPAIGRVVITPLSGPIHIGVLYARQVTAQALNPSNNVVSGAPIVWSTGRAGLSVSGSGASATLVASGVPTTGLSIIATWPGPTPVADTLVLTSDLVPVAAIDVTPATATLFPAQSEQLSASLRDSAGNTIGVSSGNPLGNRTVAWSARSGVATVSPGAGMATTVTALVAGTVDVIAAVGSRTGKATVTVTSVLAVDTIKALSNGPPAIRLGARKGNTAHEEFVVLSRNGSRMTGQTFTVATTDSTLLAVVASGSLATDSRGEGAFAIILTARARKGDAADIIVSAGGKRTVWKLTVR